MKPTQANAPKSRQSKIVPSKEYDVQDHLGQEAKKAPTKEYEEAKIAPADFVDKDAGKNGKSRSNSAEQMVVPMRTLTIGGKKMRRSLSRSETFNNQDDLKARVDLVEHALGKFVFSHTGMSLNDAFAYFDKDRDSALEKDEIKHILNQTDIEDFNEEELQMLMNRYDEDRSGGITVDEFQRTYRVERDLLLKFVKDKEECRVGFAELPVIFMFFIAFIFLLYGHDFTETKYTASTGILSGVLNPTADGRALTTVKNTQTIWSWLDNEFMDYAFVQDDLFGKPLPRKDWGYVAHYNKYVGQGVSLSQSRSVSSSCPISRTSTAYGDSCFPILEPSSTRFGPPTCSSTTTGDCVLSNFTGFEADSDKVYTAILDYTRPREELKRSLKELRKHNWIDKSTAWLEIKYVVLNQQLGTYTQVVLHFDFLRGGRVVPTYMAESLIANPYAGPHMAWAVLDILWIAFQIWTIVAEGRDLCESGWKEYCSGISGAWNILDWCQIVITITVAGIWFTMVGYLVFLLNDETANFVYTIHLILRYNVWYKLLSVANLFVLMLRFFKGFSAQPRLRIVVDSMVGAAVDLAHWFIIFVSLLFTFVMIALFLYGHRIARFSDASSAMFHTIRGWIVANSVPVNDFLKNEPGFTIVWWMLFCLVMMFVLQKMVLGIVLGSFVKTKQANRDARTLWSQTRDFCVDMNAACKKLMKLSDVIMVLEEEKYGLSDIDRVNLNVLLSSYQENTDLTPEQDKYSKQFCLSLMEEFFANYDKIRDPDMKVRRTNAYARTAQLVDDFADLNERLDLLEAHTDEVLQVLQSKFGLKPGKVVVKE